MRKFVVTKTGDLTWRVLEDEEANEEFVRYDIFEDRFKCTCKFNVATNISCKDIRFVKIFENNGQREFEL